MTPFRKAQQAEQERKFAKALTATPDMAAAAALAGISERTAWRVHGRIEAKQARQRWLDENRAYLADETVISGILNGRTVTLTSAQPPGATGLIRRS